MGNSLLVERIETFIKSVLVPKTIVETVHRGGKVFQRHRRIMVRNWEVGITGKLANGEFVVVKKLPDKYLIKFTNGPDKGKYKYVPKQAGKDVQTATEQPSPVVTSVKQPKKKEQALRQQKWTSDVPKIENFPSFILPSAVKRINKLARKVADIKYLVDKKANIVKILKGAHHPKKVKFNGIEGIFKGVGNLEIGKFLPSKKNVLTEVCSYEISRALKFDFVPPTISKIVGSEFGTVQQFVPGIEGIRIPLSERKNIFASQAGREMAIYDFITGNRDRHDGNWMYDPVKKKVWAIDNGNSFPTGQKYYIHSNFIKNFPGELSENEKYLINRKKSKVLRYVKSYFGDSEARSAAKRIDFILKTGRMVNGWVEENTLR